MFHIGQTPHCARQNAAGRRPEIGGKCLFAPALRLRLAIGAHFYYKSSKISAKIRFMQQRDRGV